MIERELTSVYRFDAAWGSLSAIAIREMESFDAVRKAELLREKLSRARDPIAAGTHTHEKHETRQDP